MKSASLIRKKYSFNNIQIMSKYELQNKYESVLNLIKPSEIIQDLSFFKDLTVYFDSSPDKAFLSYKFTLYCYLLVNNNNNNKQEKFFNKIFAKYINIFVKACDKYYIFIIIKICINDYFKKINNKITVDEFYKIMDKLIEEYKIAPYDNICVSAIRSIDFS